MKTTNPAKAKSVEVTEKVIFPDATEQTSRKHHTQHEAGGDDVVAGVGATKEIFVPALDKDDPVQSLQGVKINTITNQAIMFLLVPQDFTSITAIEIIFQPEETGASMNFDINTAYGAYNGGEAWDAHSEAASPRNIGATVANRNLNHSISDLVDVAALAAGDLLHVWVSYNSTAIDSNANVMGLRLKYS